MKMTPKDLLQFIEKQFSYQAPMLSLWQTLADNFYPERSDFTVNRNTGNELADSLLSSYPILVRRDLGNSFSSMLRDGEWFNMGVNHDPGHQAKMWLQWATKRQMSAMYDRQAGFVRATKEGDHDYATFGDAVLSVERNRKADGLLFRSWHLRDCCWWDDENGQVCGVARKWNPTLRQLINFFGEDKLDPTLLKNKHKDQLKEIDVRHVVMPAEMFGEDTHFPYVSIYLDVKNKVFIEKVATPFKHYVVPRFQTIAGSAYAYSPATVVGLPDARMLQAMTHTLMEAGERYARPPMAATIKAVRGDVDLSSDGVTWLDDEYDEKMGAALRPVYQDRGGYPIGLEMRESIVEVLSSAFYINKLSLPEVTRDMTAYEVAERMKQYRRENLPLFAPVEQEYNGALCEEAFNQCMALGVFGSTADIPEELQEQEVVFKFESPLTENQEERKVQQFNQISQMLADAVQLDPTVGANINLDEALRDAIEGAGAPEKWLNGSDEVEMIRQQMMMQQQMAMEQEQAGA